MSEVQTIVGGGNSLSQSRSVTAHPDVLKTLRHFEKRSSDSVIVESGKTSSGWWRKWSDGFIEQGGKQEMRAGSNDSNGNNVVQFFVPFSGTDYNILVTANDKSPDIIATWKNRTASSVIVNLYDSYNATQGINYWYACGY